MTYWYDKENSEVVIYNEYGSVIAIMPEVYSLQQAEELAEEVYGGYLIGLIPMGGV